MRIPKRPLISIIIATFNSEATLSLVLDSIKNQSLQRSKYEVIVVDGGSDDDTLIIAKKFKTKIINNPKTEQNTGKVLGFILAKGKYIMFLDSDEVIDNKDSLKNKIKEFVENPNTRMIICSGYKSPPGYPFVTNYINEFGDPFSYFMYHTSKDERFFIKSMRKKYQVESETSKSIIFNLTGVKDLPLVEITAGGGMIDVFFLRRIISEIGNDPEIINHSFYLILHRLPFLIISKNDALIHFSSSTFESYLNKINWRVKANIYHTSTMGKSGFSGRNYIYPRTIFGHREYLFLVYSFSLVWPLLDSLILMLTRKDVRYIIHFPLTIYTVGSIVYHSFLKFCGVKTPLTTYGHNKLI